jgi:hypothetical protein
MIAWNHSFTYHEFNLTLSRVEQEKKWYLRDAMRECGFLFDVAST